MFRLKIIYSFVFLLFCLNQNLAQVDSTAQEDEVEELAKPGPEPDTKIGIKMGSQISSILGSENTKNTASFGILGGGYLRQKLNNKNWLQTELQVSFRGSRFKAGTNEISAIRLLYIDLPILFLHSFSNTNHRFIVGTQASYLLSPTVYLQGGAVPLSGAVNIKKIDVLPVLGYQYHMPFFAIQFAAKYGLVNFNNGSTWPQNAKPSNTNGSMNNFILEFNFIF